MPKPNYRASGLVHRTKADLGPTRQGGNRRLSHVGWGEVAGSVMHANRQSVLQDGNMAVYWYGLATY